jgi:hypothetical protein
LTVIEVSFPDVTAGANGWRVQINSLSSVQLVATFYAVCVTAP